MNTAKWFAAAQHFVPQNAISLAAGKIAQSEQPHLKKALIYAFSKAYGVRLDECKRQSLDEYASFNDFFARELKDDARPIDTDPLALVCPADGAISQIGVVDRGQILQAKGKNYSAAQLLADYDDGKSVEDGFFATVYLAPSNYHRAHMPFDGTLVETRYVPGDLFSVNRATARYVPDVFARNERLVCVFDTAFGRAFVVLVGALIVAGIECVATGRLARSDRVQTRRHDTPLKKGDELGRFCLGSTAIVVLPKGSNALWDNALASGSVVRMGQRLGVLDAHTTQLRAP